MNNLVVILRAASLLKRLKHANIVVLHDIIHTRESLTFVFEYVVSITSEKPFFHLHLQTNLSHLSEAFLGSGTHGQLLDGSLLFSL